MKPFILSVLLAAVALIAGGCSTPEKRIQENPALFNSLSVADQELVKQGRVGIGFTPEVVKLAVGEPDRVWQRTDAAGTSEAWSYTLWENTDGTLLYRGYYHQYYGGYYMPFYTAYPSRREKEYFRVSFKDGRVSSVEQETR